MPIVLVDTNIFIDSMSGHAAAQQVLSDYPDSAISFVTYVEMMAGAKSPSEVVRVSELLADFLIIHSTPEIMQRAADIRNGSVLASKKVPTPDAIIAATAQITGRTFITRNTKDFAGSWVYVPYELEQIARAVNIRPPLQ